LTASDENLYAKRITRTAGEICRNCVAKIKVTLPWLILLMRREKRIHDDFLEVFTKSHQNGTGQN